MRIQSLQDLHHSFPDIDDLWNISDLDQTESRIRSRLPLEGTTLTGPQVEAMTQLVRLYSLQGKTPEARATLDSLKTLLPLLDPKERTRPEIRCHLEEGRHYCLSMSPSRALESFSEAWQKATAAQMDVFAIDAAYMISITVPVKQGKKWLQQAIEIAESSEDEFCKMWLSHLYMMDGWQAFDAHDFNRALVAFDKANSKCSLKESENKSRVFRWCKARTLRALGQYEKALKIQESLLEEMMQSGEGNGHVFLEIAECHLALQDPGKSKSFYEMAYDALKKDKWYTDNNDDELSRIQKNSKK